MFLENRATIESWLSRELHDPLSQIAEGDWDWDSKDLEAETTPKEDSNDLAWPKGDKNTLS